MSLKTTHTKLLIASGVRGDTRRYRTFHLYEQCCLLGLDTRLTHIMLPDFQKSIDTADLLVLHRAAWDPNIGRAIDTIHARGGKVIYDTDDLLFDVAAFDWIDSPDFQDPVRAGLYKEEMLRHRRTMESSDAIMTSTQYLATQASGLGKATFVHRNAFSNEMLNLAENANQSPRPADGKIIIGYASGTSTHNLDFETMGPALRHILDELKQVVLWLVGPLKLVPAWKDYESRILHLSHVPWRLLPAYLSRFDINLAPLVTDNPFAQSKSEIKWMEAALVRVPTIAGGTDTYKAAIRPGVDGLIASSLTEWADTLAHTIDDQAVRRALGTAAYHEVLRHYSPSVRANEFMPILQQVTGWDIQQRIIDAKKMNEAANRPIPLGLNRMKRHEEESPSLTRMAYYSLRHRGLGILIKQIWIFIRRLISPLIPYKPHETRR